jgi:hypothetical protein
LAYSSGISMIPMPLPILILSPSYQLNNFFLINKNLPQQFCRGRFFYL